MQGARDKLLAGAGFAANEYRRIVFRQTPNHRQNPLECRRLTNHVHAHKCISQQIVGLVFSYREYVLQSEQKLALRAGPGQNLGARIENFPVPGDVFAENNKSRSLGPTAKS
jgi:hypothetical protein